MKTYQAALLLPQVDKLIKETEIRRANADHLTAGLKKIPGIHPARLPQNSRAVWHLYPFRYDAAQFNGLSHGNFMKALQAEGIPCSGVYSELHFDGMFDEAVTSRGFQRLFSAERLKAYRDSFQEMKGNKQVCETTVAVYQSMLLAGRSDMDQIIEAVRKIHAHSAALAKA
jgi:dTDP-4-amino-4,6-dideoxygalactose transaminase